MWYWIELSLDVLASSVVTVVLKQSGSYLAVILSGPASNGSCLGTPISKEPVCTPIDAILGAPVSLGSLFHY